jgi:exonuclease SbcC
LEARLDGCNAEVERLEAEAHSLENALAQLELAGQLRDAESESAASLEQIAARRAESAPQRELVASAERTRPLLALLARRDECESELRRLDSEVARLESARSEADSELTAAHEAHERTRHEHDSGTAELARVAEELQRAAALEARLAELEPSLSYARAQLLESERVRTERRKRLNALEAEQARFKLESERIIGWRGTKPHLEAIAPQWERWRRELERWREIEREAQEAHAEHARLNAEATNASTASDVLEALRESHRQARSSEAEARRACEAADASASSHLHAQLRDEREALVEEHRREDQLRNCARSARAQAEALRSANARAEEARVRSSEHASEAERLTAELSRLSIALNEARRSLEQARAAMDLSAHRTRLRPDEPCPLCGSHEHPYGEGSESSARDSGLATLLDAQARRVDELESERLAAERARTLANAHANAVRADAEKERSIASAASKELELLQSAWIELRAHALASGLPNRVDDERVDAVLEQMGGEREARSAQLRSREDVAERSRSGAASARRALDAAQEHASRSADALRQAEARAETRRVTANASALRLERAALARTNARAELASLLGALPAIPGGIDAWITAPNSTLDLLQAEVELWRSHLETQANAEAETTRLQREIESGRAELQASFVEHARRENEVESRTKTTEAIRAERAHCCGGLSLSEARSACESKGAQLRSALESARQRESQAQLRASALGVRCSEARAIRERASEAVDKAADILSRACAAAALSEEHLRAQLGLDESELESLRAQHEKLDRAWAEAQAVHAERSERRRKHEAECVALDQAKARSTLGKVRSDLQAQRTMRAQLAATREHDAQAQIRFEELQPRIEAARTRAEMWQVLDGLIGSANGFKFKNFAQSLTLDALLEHANAHLDELARRYTLQRIPGSDLELQVIDHDLGDEVRSVHSLSGGESFLVSLALALGLGSLNARDTCVETLFIDEGFSALDADALETALATLDALQATGRQIGLISHVGSLVERVGAQVRVDKRSAGRSRVVVEGVAIDSVDVAESEDVPNSSGSQEVA